MKQETRACPEDLSRNTAQLSICRADAANDIRAVREMVPAAGNGAEKTLVVPASPFVEDEANHGGANPGEAEDFELLNNSVQPGGSHSSKRRRSSAHSISLTKERHKRKAKWTKEAVSLQFSEDSTRGLSTKDVQGFLLNVLKAKASCNTPLFQLAAPWKLNKVVFVFIPDLHMDDFNLAKGEENANPSPWLLPMHSAGESDNSNDPLLFTKSLFKYIIPTTMPESMPSPISLLLHVPYSKAAKKRRAAEISQVKLVLYDLLLTKAQMQNNGYPIHSLLDSSLENQLPDGWAETRDFEHEGSHTFALDCEFCQAESGKVLTRISMINFQNEVVYDQLVMPDEPIVDYVTKYSGITEEMLAGETTTLKDVQDKIVSLVSSKDILIGHSLNSDLNVMKIRHPKIIDTALLFDHHRGYPFKHALKYLAELYIGRTIQNGEKDGTGHSPIEDLRACLDLVKLKLIEGPDFGKILGASLFKSARETNPQLESSLMDYLLAEYDQIITDVHEPALVTSTVTSDENAIDMTLEKLSSKTFHLIWLRELQFNCGRKAVPDNYTGRLVDEANRAGGKKPPVSLEDRRKLLQDLDRRLERIYKELPVDSLLIVNTGGGDPDRMNYLNYVKRLFQRQLKAGKDLADFTADELWNFDKATELQEATESARKGLTLMTVKK